MLYFGCRLQLEPAASHCLAARPLAGRPGVAAPSGGGFRQSHFFCEHRLNRGDSCFPKGAFVAVSSCLGVYVITLLLLRLAALFSPGMLLTVQILLIFYCLAGTTLVREVRMVFKAVDRSLEEGRMQVARIVGRDTSALGAGGENRGIGDFGREFE